VIWWERCVKPAIRHIFIREGTERKHDRITLENFYYNAIYNILNEPTEHETTAITLKHLKAKITRLHHAELRRILLDNCEQDALEGEEPSIYHILKARKRQVARMVTKIMDNNGIEHTTPTTILRTLTEYMREKYSTITMDNNCFKQLVGHTNEVLSQEANSALEIPITKEDLLHAVKKGKPNKAPGKDGISQDFFKNTWNIIHQGMLEMVNKLYTDGNITNRHTA
jgi:hypothetical protein